MFDNPAGQSSTSGAISITVGMIAAAATIIGAAITWFKDRNKGARRIQVIDEATKYLAFWQSVHTTELSLASEEQKPQLVAELTGRISSANLLVIKRGTRNELYSPGNHEKQFKRLNKVALLVAVTAGLLYIFPKFSPTVPSSSISQTTATSSLNIALGSLAIISLGVIYRVYMFMTSGRDPGEAGETD